MTVPKVAVAMSGGVDSSVAALLLKEVGYDVIGVTMRLTDSHKSAASAENAASIAAKLGIKHYTADLSQEFQKHVIDYFCEAYQTGQTPNPCIVCNKQIKFGALLKYAESLGAEYLASGHYARIQSGATGYRLYKAVDTKKDQSYFLYRLNQTLLNRIMLPMGELTKNKVRQLALSANLQVPENESQDICFLEEQDYQSFLKGSFPMLPGEIVNEHGEIIGQHSGISRYTIGQRHGLNISGKHPQYVIGIDAARNRITLGAESALLKQSVKIRDLNWISGSWPEDISSLSAKIRYRMPDSPIMSLTVDSQDSAIITFEKPVRAVTPGQSAVIYRCDEVLGGGIIIA
ncbi:tRNA 2-thiouridine(34) synthase MnmA [Dehalogenimonas etheniformans]|uniref:tRNA-specific 2-thiouridylase MnmA n=1 Tax=Dehalogenimonas etheniformans TaxID=1536648 RepID=A0A2P5P998_9CHLR|nr:tRNA 2-thiouridine(34) synthase MnmA [Dehalogenimonas etheniformans]PPD58866.1 tRNA 2-thiouridine(34) synthase MnmA [Dehalogenimonas etheniformans]QNT76366.1 tRNA 2-thiouridine(34) synthase MnmA [Dehalogenimonas etheniformans]